MEKNKDHFFVLLICLITFFWAVILFSHFKLVVTGEWDHAFAYHQLERTIILEYRQFPLWNPYLCGGEPWLAHPQANFLSPLFIPVLIFGAIKGTIILYFLQALIGLLGIYFLSRHYLQDEITSLFSAAASLTIFTMLAYPGVFQFLSIAFIPWVYLFFNKSKTDKRYIFYTMALMVLILMSCLFYIFIMAFIILFIDAIFYSYQHKTPRSIIKLFYICFFALLLSSPRILPMLELLKGYPRITTLPPAHGFLNPANLWNGAILLNNFLFSHDLIWHIYASSVQYPAGNMPQHCLLVVLIAIFIFSCIVLWREHKALVITNIILLLLLLGDHSPINLWRPLHFLFPSMRGPHKFFTAFMMTFSLSLGLTIKVLQNKFPERRAFKSISLILLFTVILGNYIYAGKITVFNQGAAYHLDSSAGQFSQTNGDPDKMFEIIYRNQGNLSSNDRSDVIGNQIRTRVLAREEAGYRGEYYLQNGFGQAEQVMFSPHKLVFKLKLSNDDTLVINQNYFPGWHSSVGRVVSRNGLISVALNKKNTDLILYYLPGSFVVGIILFLLSLLLIFYIGKQKQ